MSDTGEKNTTDECECGNEKSEADDACLECLEIDSHRYSPRRLPGESPVDHKRRERAWAKAHGMCATCINRPKHEESESLCWVCLDKHNEKNKALKKRRRMEKLGRGRIAC